MLPVGHLLSQITSLMWNEVRKGVDWESGELGSILGPCDTGHVTSLLSGPWAPHLYTEGFHWVRSNVTHDHCLSLERQGSIVIKISGSGGSLTWH